MKLGKFEIDLVDTGIFGLDGGSMFGVVPKALWSKRYHSGDTQNRIPLAARPMLIRYDDKKILVDTGNGTKHNEKFVKIYDVDLYKSSLDVALKPFGISRVDITDVILTHLHFDHAGGATMIEKGEVLPTFPNAKYFVQKQQYDWALNPAEKDQASFLQDDFVPLRDGGMLEFVEGEGSIYHGIDVIPVNGHTKSMQMVKLTDGGQSLLYMADLCPTSAHIGIPFVMGYDNYPLTTIEEKKKYFPLAYEEDWIIVFEHDAFNQAGRLMSTEKGFVLKEKVTITE